MVFLFYFSYHEITTEKRHILYLIAVCQLIYIFASVDNFPLRKQASVCE